MRLVTALCLVLVAGPGFAADIDVTSRVAAVTLYPDGATVTRVIPFDLGAGDATLVARDFPLGLDPSSIRMQGEGDTAVVIGAVDARQVYVEAPGPDLALTAAIRALQDQREGIDGEINALTVKKAFIERVAGSAALFGAGETARPIDPAVLRAAWTTVGEDLSAVNEALRLARIRMRDLDEAIARKEAERDGRASGAEMMEIRIAVSAAQAAKGSVSVSYVVGGARWTPLYDARLDTVTGKLDLVRRAEVSQSTGEDWTDVAMTISTARATAGAAAPTLQTRFVQFVEPVPAMAGASETERLRNDLALAEPAAPAVEAAAPRAAKVAVAEAGATLDTGGFQSVWRLPGAVTVASGPATRSLRLDAMAIDPALVARSVPAIDPTAYLEASFAHAGETPLFPGRVAIYRDGLYAGVSSIGLATAGETVRLGFGADDLIKIERRAVRRQQSETGLVSTSKNDRREYEIAVRNGRPTPIRLSIEEALPVSEIAEIRVEMTAATTPPTVTDADGRRGVLVWTRDLAVGATDTIAVGYTVSWPSDRQITLDAP